MENPRRPSGWKGPALIVLALCSTGCFRYVPAQLGTTAPGEAVRVLIAPGGTTELANISDVVEDVPIVDGTVVGVEGQDLLLQVPIARRLDGFTSTNLNQTIRIPTTEIVSFRRREFDKVSSGFVIAGAVGLASAVVAFILDSSGKQEPGAVVSPDDAVVQVRLFSVSLGR